VITGVTVAKGVVILPKSVTHTRIASNMTGAITAAQKLDKADMERLDGVAAGGKQKRLVMPPWGKISVGSQNGFDADISLVP
jgi:glycerol 2-dehydrogenase (NADP+)